MRVQRIVHLLASLGVLAFSMVCLSLLGDLRLQPWPGTGLLVASTFAGLNLIRTHKRWPRNRVLAALVAIHLLGLLSSPTLSDDIYRYVHEGRALRLGLATPYAIAPKDITPPPDDGTSTKVNHPDVPAAYPPFAELTLGATAAFGDALGRGSLGIRLLALLADLAILGVLFRTKNDDSFVRFGAHPLVLLEVCIGAHLDIIGVALLVIALMTTSRTFLRGILIGLAMGIKPTALIAWVRDVGQVKKTFFSVLLGVVIFFACAGPFLFASAPLTRGLFQYATRWTAQPTLYALVDAGISSPFERRVEKGIYTHLHIAKQGLRIEEAAKTLLSVGISPGEHATKLLLDARFFARLICAGLFLLLAGGVLWHVQAADDRVGWTFFALWLCAPAVHPWYFLWVLPWLLRSTGVWLFCAAAPLAYQAAVHAASTGIWQEALWPRGVMFFALASGLAWDRFHADAPETPSLTRLED